MANVHALSQQKFALMYPALKTEEIVLEFSFDATFCCSEVCSKWYKEVLFHSDSSPSLAWGSFIGTVGGGEFSAMRDPHTLLLMSPVHLWVSFPYIVLKMYPFKSPLKDALMKA